MSALTDDMTSEMTAVEAARAGNHESAVHAAVNLFTSRGFRAFGVTGGAGLGGSVTGWHSLVISPGPSGPSGVSNSVLTPCYQSAWDKPETDDDPIEKRRHLMTQVYLRTLDSADMLDTRGMLEQYLRSPSPAAAVYVSLYLPPWWADRIAEGYTEQAARTMLALILPPHFASQVEFADAGLPTLRGFAVVTATT